MFQEFHVSRISLKFLQHERVVFFYCIPEISANISFCPLERDRVHEVKGETATMMLFLTLEMFFWLVAAGAGAGERVGLVIFSCCLV